MTIRISLGQGPNIVNVGTTSTLLIAANPNRKLLKWEVLAGDVTVVPGAGPAVYGQGFVYSAGNPGSQGGSQTFDTVVPTDAFQVISNASGAQVAVWEGE